METPFVLKVREYTFELFRDQGKSYGELPYEYHCAAVAEIARRHEPGNLSVEESEVAEAAALGHDILEDIPDITFNDLLKTFVGFTPFPEIARLTVDAIYDCTNQRGRDRVERGVPAWLACRDHRVGKYVKMCDRLANTAHSTQTSSRMRKLYYEEYPTFRFILRRFVGEFGNQKLQFASLWDELDSVSEFRK
jgi:hypothetical protein